MELCVCPVSGYQVRYYLLCSGSWRQQRTLHAVSDLDHCPRVSPKPEGWPRPGEKKRGLLPAEVYCPAGEGMKTPPLSYPVKTFSRWLKSNLKVARSPSHALLNPHSLPPGQRVYPLRPVPLQRQPPGQPACRTRSG